MPSTQSLVLAVCPQYLEEARVALASLGPSGSGVEVVAHARTCDRGAPSWDALLPTLDGNGANGAREVCWIGSDACLPREAPGPATHIVERRPLCFEFVTNRAVVEAEIVAGAHLVTSGWLRGWRTHLETLGYDQTIAREHFGEFARRVLLLDTGVDTEAAVRLDEFAAFVALPAATLRVGTDVFAAHLRGIVHAWLARCEAKASAHAMARLADAEMLLDLVGRLALPATEHAVLKRIVDVVAMFLPQEHRMTVATVERDTICHELRSPAASRPASAALASLGPRATRAPSALTATGFTILVRYHDAVLGLIDVDDIATPELVQRYANLVTVLAPICGLAITYARTLSGVLPICSGCKRIRDANGAWRDVEVYVRDHSAATFSHGLCPECRTKIYPDLG